MDSTYISTVKLLAATELGQVISLYHYIVTKGIIEIGSSSMDPLLAESCGEIRELMRREFQIEQYNELFSASLAIIGDTSARLYFGGRRYLRSTNEWKRVPAREYIELLASKINNLSENAQVALEVIARDSVLMSQAPRTPLTFNE